MSKTFNQIYTSNFPLAWQEHTLTPYASKENLSVNPNSRAKIGFEWHFPPNIPSLINLPARGEYCWRASVQCSLMNFVSQKVMFSLPIDLREHAKENLTV